MTTAPPQALTVTCHCGGQIRPCGVPPSPSLFTGQPDASWGNASCCLLGWRHVTTGFHGCPDVGGKPQGYARPADAAHEIPF